MSLAVFERLLKDAIGLDVESIGRSSIGRAVKARQQACGLPDADAYREHLGTSTTELQELIDAVIVPETWFFRDREAFAALEREVSAQWLRVHPDGVLRLLSLPCATGEEPYSMAMALLDAGFPPHRFHIDGIDISDRVLAHARTGLYGKSSFRGNELSFRDRHFAPVAQGHQVADRVCRHTRFVHGNLLSPACLSDGEPYDVIFCRNLLIYFDRDTQERAIAALSQRLAPGGFLFVGASETGVLASHDFVSIRVPMSFAFQKGAFVAREPRTAALPLPVAVRRPARPASPPTSAPRTPHRHTPRASSREAPRALPSAPAIEDVQRLADAGRVAEAAEACEAHLRVRGPSAAAFYLMGLVRDASGRSSDAEACYRKALYLDPSHSEALAHLALLMDTQGRQADALVLRNRMRRLEFTPRE